MWYFSTLHCWQNTSVNSFISYLCLPEPPRDIIKQGNRTDLHSLDKENVATSQDPTHFCNRFLQLLQLKDSPYYENCQYCTLLTLVSREF